MDKGYFTLIKHVNRILRRKLWHGIMEDYIVKYCWTAIGFAGHGRHATLDAANSADNEAAQSGALAAELADS